MTISMIFNSVIKYGRVQYKRKRREKDNVDVSGLMRGTAQHGSNKRGGGEWRLSQSRKVYQFAGHTSRVGE